MTLPLELEERFKSDLLKFEEDQKMQYVTSIERNAIELGRKEGKKEGKKEIFLQLLREKFGKIPKEITQKINNASETDLQGWTKQFLQAETLQDLFPK